MKKYIGFIGVAMVNCMLITGLLVHAFTLNSIKDNTVNDSKKQYVYMEKTTVKEEKEIEPEERQQKDNNDNKDYTTNNTKNHVVKTTIKYTYNNKNNSNDNKNNSNNTNNNSNENDTNNSNNTNNNINENDANNSNNNYTVEYTNTSYCGFCGKQLNSNDGICQDCREIRSKLGE